MPSPTSSPRLALACLPATAAGLALSIQISALSWLLTTRYGLSPAQVAIVWSTAPIAGLLEPVFGILSDRTWWLGGRRRPYVLAGGAVATVSLLALPRLDAISAAMPASVGVFPIALAVTFALGLAINLALSPGRALVADLTQAGAERERSFLFLQAASGGASVLAYLAGGAFGNAALVDYGAATVLALIALPGFALREPRRPASAHRADVPDAAAAAEARVSASARLLPYLANGAAWIGMPAVFVFLIEVARPLAATDAVPDAAAGRMVARSLAVLNSMGFVAPLLVLGPLTRRLGAVRAHVTALAIGGIAFVAMAGRARSEWALLATMVVGGVGWAAMLSLPPAIFSERAGRGGAGLRMGLYNLSLVIPQILLAVLGASAPAIFAGGGGVFAVAGGGLLVSAVLWAATLRKARGRRVDADTGRS